MAVAEKVRSTVEDLARSGAARFHASYVAEQAHADIDESKAELLRLVEQGELEQALELVCPETGRTVATYRLNEEIPFGDTFACEMCGEEHVVSANDIWVTFTPTYKMSARLARASSAPKAPWLDRLIRTAWRATGRHLSSSGPRCR